MGTLTQGVVQVSKSETTFSVSADPCMVPCIECVLIC